MLTSGQVEAAAHVNDAIDVAVLGCIEKDGIAAFAVPDQGEDAPSAESEVVYDGPEIVGFTPVSTVSEFPVALAVAREIEPVSA